MAVIYIKNTGVDHLYPDGVEIFESNVDIAKAYKEVERITSRAVLTDPYFAKMSKEAKTASELHPAGDRSAADYSQGYIDDILPIFGSKQRWLVVDGSLATFTHSAGSSVVFRWENHDTRTSESKQDYSPLTREDIRIDTNAKQKVDDFLYRALVSFLLREHYKAIGYDKRYVENRKLYEVNRAKAAYYIKSDTSYQRQLLNGGV